MDITVLYAPPNVISTPTVQTVSYGNSATVTVLVDTANKTTYPTGTVTLADANTGAIISGPVTCVNAQDSSGYYACQAVATFVVTSGDGILILYHGDANFPPAEGYATINMPDFMIYVQGGVSVTAGQSQNVTIAFESVNGLTGTVSNFGCSGLPAETTCVFSPTQATLNSGNTTTVTVATSAIGQLRRRASNEGRSGLGGAMLLLAVCLVGLPLTGRRGRSSTAMMVIAGLLAMQSCGGGNGGGAGGGGGGGGGGTGGTANPVPSISSLSPTQVAAGSQVNSLYINGSNFMSSSTVNYNGTLHNSSLQNSTQIQIALGPDDVATTGQYPVVVTNPTPGGGASAPVDFAVVTGTPTGAFYITLTASCGPITHTTTMIMYVQ